MRDHIQQKNNYIKKTPTLKPQQCLLFIRQGRALKHCRAVIEVMLQSKKNQCYNKTRNPSTKRKKR